MTKWSVTEEQVEAMLKSATIHDMQLGNKTTLVWATLKNGFVIVESSSCVDPKNYDHELGRQICMKRIADKIWEMEGYVTQCLEYSERERS